MCFCVFYSYIGTHKMGSSKKQNATGKVQNRCGMRSGLGSDMGLCYCWCFILQQYSAIHLAFQILPVLYSDKI